MNSRILTLAPLLLALGALALGCEPPAPGPQGDSHTNWLRTCEADADCGSLSCVCGVCTLTCTADADCAGVEGSSCLPPSQSRSAGLCDGHQPPAVGMCLPSAPTSEVAVDSSLQFQQLTGFGATVGYAEDELTAFSDRAALDEAMFAGLGLDVLRFRNRYGEVSDATLAQATAIVAAATRSLGRAPLVLLGSWSPPATLKQNGATFCGSDPTTCKLTRNAAGEFNYAGLATHFRDSLEAYASVGFLPDYLSIQNNPDWVPTGGAVNEASRFLSTEGKLDVLVNGVSMSVSYPGYREALDAVLSALSDLPTKPRMLAPDLSGLTGTDRYVEALQGAPFDAIAHHLYGTDARNFDLNGLRTVAQLHDDMGVPVFQTEMQANGFDTAVLMHHALVDGGASMYLQTALIGPLSGPATNASALVGMDGDEFVLQGPYFAMGHYARFTDPGWVRVQATTAAAGLLTSAWLSPDHAALSVIFTNTNAVPLVVSLQLGREKVRSARLTLSAFDGTERLSDLGEWTPGRNISLPAHSIATLLVEE
jgi:glucuronoarabinoxylan endo-1,4-beta-xylanase